ncbi:uncharacterized protein LOC141530806 isoform X2 [Cotesia typhae]|uniref:uncharacterized protein LOC141530806 isoform X2 n=1 Tax=Cotesia typhae TaxID=2053667 RepID=UPI003D685B47
MIRSYSYLPYIKDYDKVYSVYNCFSLLGEYLAYIIFYTGEVNLINIKTEKQLLIRPIFLEGSYEPPQVNRIQIWLTEDQKIFLVISWKNKILIFNAEDGRQYVTPPVFTDMDRYYRIVSRRFDNEVFIVGVGKDLRLLNFFQLEFSDQDEIIAKEILRITQPTGFDYRYEKLYHENRTIMVVFDAIPATVDETDFSERFCKITIVRLPRSITQPINIDTRDRRYTITLLRRFFNSLIVKF